MASTTHESAPGYGNGPGYWNTRYTNDPEPFEWLENYFDLRDMILNLSGGKKDCRILHVGCGNSALTENMYDDGFLDIVNIDNSSVVIGQMLERNRHRPSMQWLEMDATQLAFADRVFDLVLDKSVLDTFACTDNALLTIGKYLMECERVLRPGGVYFCISYGAPSTRQSLFDLPHVDLSYEQIEIPPKSSEAKPHYAYILRKPLVPSPDIRNSCGA
mmetsp:Transcript_82409/g.229602  ORF Transcript_82409/g.229602 Transcript_82409/m.229602 type:complete len:217 (-) Transcript_82409:112-762(-)|eukprot:CAMPEP_0117590800 /NCGR_PEP_ID=MMETSP0784-20121206/71175_1 /TAXON_ID=39447 /ORGANISM="" /LENGTH=216 /DNA_ID=CAMNT_0005392445 /DNA_START=84 /DNA_END=734 /DNA_ORIENTATION=-